MERHFVVKNDAGEYFVGYERNYKKGDQERPVFEPKFGQLIEDGFSLAVVFDYGRKTEVETSLALAGIKHRLIEV